jgi:hypothetical protein
VTNKQPIIGNQTAYRIGDSKLRQGTLRRVAGVESQARNNRSAAELVAVCHPVAPTLADKLKSSDDGIYFRRAQRFSFAALQQLIVLKRAGDAQAHRQAFGIIFGGSYRGSLLGFPIIPPIAE